MRKFLIFAFMLLSSIGAFAQHRSEQEAMQIAQKFFQSEKQRSPMKLAVVPQQRVKQQIRMRLPASSVSQGSGCYVVNDEANGRFVIVSADERMHEVLGYSVSGTFDAETAAPALLELIDGYGKDNDFLAANGQSVRKAEDGNESFPDIQPLIKTKWGQRAPFWNQCPYNKNITEEHPCFTGCVATAMAQVMNYFRYPTGFGSGSKTYKTDFGVSLSMDFANTSFDWNLMKDTYNYYYDDNCVKQDAPARSAAEDDEVAKLMLACGISVSMKYGVQNEDGEGDLGSSASTSTVATALVKYFGYNPNTVYLNKSSFTNDVWNALIVRELKAAHPVVYCGSNDENIGHSFVLDGCNADGMFHLNFGWYGRSDGYYRLQGTDDVVEYKNGQGMVCQIAPELYGQQMDRIITASTFSADRNEVQQGDQVQFRASVNPTGGFEGEVGVALFDEEWNFIKKLYSEAYSNLVSQNGSTAVFVLSAFEINASIVLDGSLFANGLKGKIAPYFQRNSDNVLKNMVSNVMEPVFIPVEVGNNVIKLLSTNSLTIENNVAGQLADRLSLSEKNKVQSMTITGELNGTDIKFLRNLLQNGMLTTLDMGNAAIVEGGESYYKEYTTSNNVVGDYMFYNCERLLSVTIPSSTTAIGEWAFKACSFSKINIPNSVLSIGSYAFKDCKYLKEVIIPEGVVTLPYGILTGCESLTNVRLPSSLTVIQNDAFHGCKMLSEITLPTGLKTIGGQVFYKCTNLKNILIPRSVSSIGQSAFEGCTSLESLIMPEGVQEIAYRVLYGCTNLNEVELPSTITMIRGNSFTGCSSLAKIKSSIVNIGQLKNTRPDEGKAFSGIADNCTWHVPSGTKSRYESQEWWNDTWTIIDDLGGVPGDSNGDGIVDVQDIVMIVNYIMENAASDFVFENADLNGDGYVDVADIPLVVSEIMNAEAPAASRIWQQTESLGDSLTLDEVIRSVRRDYTLRIGNASRYVAMQLDLVMPEGLTNEDVNLSFRYTDGHTVAWTRSGDDRYRVIVYSTANNPFVEDGHQLHFKATYGGISVENAIGVDAQGKAHRLGLAGVETTGIDTIRTESQLSSVFAIDGRRVGNERQQKGIYIINGKKQLIK